jgi:hypothetical protein
MCPHQSLRWGRILVRLILLESGVIFVSYFYQLIGLTKCHMLFV